MTRRGSTDSVSRFYSVQTLTGVSGIIHVVAYVAPDMQLEQASAVNVQMNLAILQAAAETPSIKRMVITSTASSTYTYQPNVELTITNKLWNEDAAKLAQTAPADDPYKMWYIYSAAKVAGDKTAWKFMEENKVRDMLCSPSCSRNRR